MRNAYAILGVAFTILIIGTILLVEKNMLTLTSPAFEHNGNIPSIHTCDGEGIQPELTIGGVDENAQSLVLIMDDPDVPKNLREDGMWDHFIKFNIPVDTKDIDSGISGIGTSGNLDYHGPCPPDGEHRYFFKLYSLDTKLNLSEGVTKSEVEKEMEGHILQQTELIGLYNRK